MRDKIGDYRDWKDGIDAFRSYTNNKITELQLKVNKLELIIEGYKNGNFPQRNKTRKRK